MSVRGRALSGGSSIVSSPRRKERNTNFKVVIRVRPPLPRELSGDIPFKNVVAVDAREQLITVSENLESVLDEEGNVIANPGPYIAHTFAFDHVYDQTASQKKVFETTARTVVESALQGYNATIFAYGQTSTGKTYSMEGFNSDGNIEGRGIIPRAIEQIFGHIQRNVSPRKRFLVRASYLQIYNEQISDLLKPEKSNMTIREDKKRGVYVEGLSEWVVRSPAEIYGLMERGAAVRATGETRMNEMSSRSHAVFIVIAEQSDTIYVDDQGEEMTADEFNKFMHTRGVKREGDMQRLEDHIRQIFKVGKLNLVDLAGSERVRLSGATGQRLEESKQINRSLSALGNVIAALTELKGRQHIPYRDSKLTRILEDSLGGNCKTTMMAMLSPALEAMQETLSTLKFANRAKNIKNEARVNEDLDQKSLLRKYERELKKLRAELDEKSRNVVDKRRLLELEEQRKRAEADKMAAIRALEARSREFMVEKEEKKKLEQRIAMLMGQMIRGERYGGPSPGGNASVASGDDPTGAEMQVLMKEQQERLRKEYEVKLADLERERETIIEEKAQVDRYKQLLLKQRDIMIALTQRLVERDEQIMALQDELDVYDRHHKELEEKLDEKTAYLIKLQRLSMEVNASSPVKSDELTRTLESWDGNRGQMPSSGAHEVVRSEDSEEDGDDVSRGNKTYSGSLLHAKSTVQAECHKFVKLLSSQGSASPRHVQEYAQNMINEINRSIDAAARHQNKSNGSSSPSTLKEENIVLQSRIRQLEMQLNRHNTQEQDAELQSRCESLIREREAVHTIMEQKIKVLVNSVAQAVGAVLQNGQGGGTAGPALAKDVAALQRLVNASIAALRNAASNQGKKAQRPPFPTQQGDDHMSVSSSRSYASVDASLHEHVVNSRSVENQQRSPDEKRSASTGRLNFYRPPGFPPPPTSPQATRHTDKMDHSHQQRHHRPDHVRFAASSGEDSYNRIRERYS